jgi:hypothetical protein
VVAEFLFEVGFDLVERRADFGGQVRAIQTLGDPLGGTLALAVGVLRQRAGHPMLEDIAGGVVEPGFAGAELGEDRFPIAQVAQGRDQPHDDTPVRHARSLALRFSHIPGRRTACLVGIFHCGNA